MDHIAYDQPGLVISS